jgi:hypothetical protein
MSDTNRFTASAVHCGSESPSDGAWIPGVPFRREMVDANRS